MTQTNNSELESLEGQILYLVDNQLDSEYDEELIDLVRKVFAAGVQSGIAKAEKCVPEIVTYNDDDLINYGSHHAAGRNFAYREVRENIAKLKNL